MKFVLLTDDNEGAALVACPDEATANEVGSAAIFGDGGVAAYRLPEIAFVDHERVAKHLWKGREIYDLFQRQISTAPVTTEVVELPEAHRKVLDECVAEAWRNHEQNDATTERDVAADVAQRLVDAFDVVTHPKESL